MVLDFTYIPETWKWQLTCVRGNQIYFGCFHGKTELNILCLDPTAESKWIENSQLFLSWAKCAICSHKVHLLVATVLQHYHKVPCDQGLVYKSRKILWVTESNIQDSRKTKIKTKEKQHKKTTHHPQKNHHKAQGALSRSPVNTVFCVVVISLWCLKKAELWSETFPGWEHILCLF